MVTPIKPAVPPANPFAQWDLGGIARSATEVVRAVNDHFVAPVIRRAAAEAEVAQELKVLLGDHVAAVHRDADGALTLRRLPATDFKSFCKFLQDQASQNDNFSFRSPYKSLLQEAKYKPLLRLLFREATGKTIDVVELETLQKLLYEFRNDMVGVDAEAFVQGRISTEKGRAQIAMILRDPAHYDRNVRADLTKAVAQMATTTLSDHRIRAVTDHISQANTFNIRVSDADLSAAEQGALKILQTLDQVDQNIAERRNYAALDKTDRPEFLVDMATASDVNRMTALVRETAQAADPVNQLKGKFAALWLLAMDNRNWAGRVNPKDRNAHHAMMQVRRHMLVNAERLIDEANGVKSQAAFKKLIDRADEVLTGSLKLEGATLGDFFAHHIAGRGLDTYLADMRMPAPVRKPFDELLRSVLEFSHTLDMGKTINLMPPLSQESMALPEAAPVVRALEQMRYQIWSGYKSQGWASRGVKQLASAMPGSQLGILEKGDRDLTRIIHLIGKAASPEDVKFQLEILLSAMESGGSIYEAMDSAEVGGVEQVMNLAQTTIEIAGPAMIPGGQAAALARLQKIGAALKTARTGAAVVRGAAAVGRLSPLATRAAKGLATGGYIATAENAMRVASGGASEGPQNAVSWFKDAVATGASTALTAFLPLHVGRNPSQNIFKNLYARYTVSGLQGAGRFAMDTGMEVVEEAADQMLRQGLDGKWEWVSKSQLREIGVISAAGGGTKVGMIAERIRGTDAVTAQDGRPILEGARKMMGWMTSAGQFLADIAAIIDGPESHYLTPITERPPHPEGPYPREILEPIFFHANREAHIFFDAAEALGLSLRSIVDFVGQLRTDRWFHQPIGQELAAFKKAGAPTALADHALKNWKAPHRPLIPAAFHFLTTGVGLQKHDAVAVLLQIEKQAGKNTHLVLAQLPALYNHLRTLGRTDAATLWLVVQLAATPTLFAREFAPLLNALTYAHEQGWTDTRTLQELGALHDPAQVVHSLNLEVLPSLTRRMETIGLTDDPSGEEALQFFKDLAVHTRQNAGWIVVEKLAEPFATLTRLGLSRGEAKAAILQLAEWGETNTAIYAEFSRAVAAIEPLGITGRKAFQLVVALKTISNAGGSAILSSLVPASGYLVAQGYTGQKARQFLTQMAQRRTTYFTAILGGLPKFHDNFKKLGLTDAEAFAFVTELATMTGDGVLVLFDLEKMIPHFTTLDITRAHAQRVLRNLARYGGRHNAILLNNGLTVAVPKMAAARLSGKTAADFLCDLAQHAGINTAFALLSLALPKARHRRAPFMAAYHRILDCLTEYNGQAVLAKLGNFVTMARSKLTRDMEMAYIQLVATLIEHHPKLAGIIIEGIHNGLKHGQLPRDQMPDQDRLLAFVDRTHGFMPKLYELYQTQGDALFNEMDRYKALILDDELSGPDFHQLFTEKGIDYVMGLIQSTSPTSGASFVSGADIGLLLLRNGLVGDLRDHVPEPLRERRGRLRIKQGQWQLKEGATADASGAIAGIIHHLQGEARHPTAKHVAKLETQLTLALRNHIAAGESDATLLPVQKALYRLASAQDPIRVQLGMVNDMGHTALALLEQLLSDKDLIPKHLYAALDKIPKEELRNRGANRTLQNPKGFAKQLASKWTEWESESPELRRERMLSMLQNYHPDDLARLKQQPGLPAAIFPVLDEAATLGPVLPAARVANAVLGSILAVIRSEKDHYAYRETGSIPLTLRAVKGPGFGLHGLTSGVCTAGDSRMWQDKNFFLLALVDEDRQQVVGYLHAYTVERGGRKFLTLPGINPSIEFMESIKATELYPKLMERVASFAAIAGYDAVMIPKEPLVHSNRSDISAEIRGAHYPTYTFDQPIHWNSNDNHDFDDAYIIWERGRPGPHVQKVEADLPGLPVIMPVRGKAPTPTGEALLQSLPPDIHRDVVDHKLNSIVADDLVREGMTDPARFADAMRVMIAIENGNQLAAITALQKMGYETHTAALMARALLGTLVADRGRSVGALLSLSDADVHHALKAAEYREGGFSEQTYCSYAHLLQLGAQAGTTLTVEQLTGLSKLHADQHIPTIIKTSLGAVDLPMAIQASLYQLEAIRQLRPEGFVHVEEPVAKVTLNDRYLLALDRGRYDAAAGMQFTLYDKSSLKRIATVGFIETDRGIFITRYQGGSASETLAKMIKEFQKTTGGVAPLPWLSVVAGQLLLARAQARGKVFGFIAGKRVLNGYPRTQKLYDAAARDLGFDMAVGDAPFHIYHKGSMDMGRNLRPTNHATRFDLSLEAATHAMQADPLFGKWINASTELHQQQQPMQWQQQPTTPAPSTGPVPRDTKSRLMMGIDGMPDIRLIQPNMDGMDKYDVIQDQNGAIAGWLGARITGKDADAQVAAITELGQAYRNWAISAAERILDMASKSPADLNDLYWRFRGVNEVFDQTFEAVDREIPSHARDARHHAIVMGRERVADPLETILGQLQTLADNARAGIPPNESSVADIRGALGHLMLPGLPPPLEGGPRIVGDGKVQEEMRVPGVDAIAMAGQWLIDGARNLWAWWNRDESFTIERRGPDLALLSDDVFTDPVGPILENPELSPSRKAAALRQVFYNAHPFDQNIHATNAVLSFIELICDARLTDEEIRAGARDLARALMQRPEHETGLFGWFAPNTLGSYMHNLLGIYPRDILRTDIDQINVWTDEIYAGLMQHSRKNRIQRIVDLGRKQGIADVTSILGKFLRGELGVEPGYDDIRALMDTGRHAETDRTYDIRARILAHRPRFFQFLSGEFLDAMSSNIKDMADNFRAQHGRDPVVVEIAAGDGQLTQRLNARLAAHNIRIRATDNNAWELSGGSAVQHEDAVQSAKSADIILASWLPSSSHLKAGEHAWDVELLNLLEAHPEKSLVLISSDSPTSLTESNEFRKRRTTSTDLDVTQPRSLNWMADGRPLPQSTNGVYAETGSEPDSSVFVIRGKSAVSDEKSELVMFGIMGEDDNINDVPPLLRKVASPATSAAVRELLKGQKFQRHYPLLDQVLQIGKDKDLQAHGTSPDDFLGGLHGIIINGVLKRGFRGSLREGDPSYCAGPHGPFYIIINPGLAMRNPLATDLMTIYFYPKEAHLAYLVPTPEIRELYNKIIDLAVRYGDMTVDDASTAKSKLVTYKEFIAKNGEGGMEHH